MARRQVCWRSQMQITSLCIVCMALCTLMELPIVRRQRIGFFACGVRWNWKWKSDINPYLRTTLELLWPKSFPAAPTPPHPPLSGTRLLSDRPQTMVRTCIMNMQYQCASHWYCTDFSATKTFHLSSSVRVRYPANQDKMAEYFKWSFANDPSRLP